MPPLPATHIAYSRSAFPADKDIILRVYIIRHGEKPDSGENLSDKGFNRSLKLPTLLNALVGILDYTYVPTIYTGKQTSDLRMMQTVTPFAIQNNLTINSNYKKEDAAGVAKSVMKKKGTILLVWEHENIPLVARALGARKPPVWDSTDFDSIWIVTYTKHDLKKGRASLFITSVRENITPAPD